MNGHPIRTRSLAPLLTLGAALIIGGSALLTSGVNADGVPTPSETSVATTSIAPAMTPSDRPVVVETTPDTGTSPLVAP